MADADDLLQDPAVLEFKETLKRCTLKAACGNEYVLVEKFTNWLRSEIPGSHTSYAHCLLQVVYRSRNQYAPEPPISSESLCHPQNGCLLVFSILLELGRGDLITSFQRQGVEDNLPIDLVTLRSTLKGIDRKELPDPLELAEKFDDMQWRFCAKQLSLYMGRDLLPDNTIIPIHKKEKIKSGGTAEVWMILVLEEFVSEDLRKVVKSSGFSDPNDNLGYRYQFALKTFEEGNRSYYLNEKGAFDGLRKHEGMVRYLGDFGLKQAVSIASPLGPLAAGPKKDVVKNTYNILLEYGDLDLDDFFYERLPPLLECEVVAFWRSMLDVAEAVEGIHHLKADRGELVDEYRGWHADIKPDKILSVDGKFKLCDPGFAKFVKTNEKNDMDLKELVLGGTETYGAPERLLAGNEAVSVLQTIDTWSLGCVFSVAATWVVLDYQGIRQFSMLRRKAVEHILREAQSGRRPSNVTPKLKPGDYFHDGQNVLTDIKDWHMVLRNALRKNDPITSRILDLVDRCMLLGPAENRWNAKRVCGELKELLAEAAARCKEYVPPKIMDAFIAVDEAAPSKAGVKIIEARPERSQHLTISDARQARKSKRLDEPLLKTSHRSEGRKSALPPPIPEEETLPRISKSPVEMDPPVPEDKMTPPPRFQPLSQVEDVDALQGIGHTRSSPSSPTSPQRNRPLLLNKRRTTPQNVFQAREAIEEREKRNYLKLTRKDERLSKHFGNRDIKFLIDNAETMKPFWYEATYLLGTLVMKAVGQDKDGTDLYFTSGPVKVLGKKSKFLRHQGQAEYVEAMHNKSAKPMDEIQTDMRASLGKLLSAYIREAEISRNKGLETRKLTIIVLTDGKWEGMGGKDDVRKLVIKFVENLKIIIGDLESRPVSIEFIQFGDDADATYRLRQLDTGLKGDGIEDIIDTEPSGGDVNKMLLGNFAWIYDNDAGEAEEEGGAEISVQRMNFTKSRQGTRRPARSSAPTSSLPQRYSPIHQLKTGNYSTNTARGSLANLEWSSLASTSITDYESAEARLDTYMSDSFSTTPTSEMKVQAGETRAIAGLEVFDNAMSERGRNSPEFGYAASRWSPRSVKSEDPRPLLLGVLGGGTSNHPVISDRGEGSSNLTEAPQTLSEVQKLLPSSPQPPYQEPSQYNLEGSDVSSGLSDGDSIDVEADNSARVHGHDLESSTHMASLKERILHPNQYFDNIKALKNEISQNSTIYVYGGGWSRTSVSSYNTDSLLAKYPTVPPEIRQDLPSALPDQYITSFCKVLRLSNPKLAEKIYLVLEARNVLTKTWLNLRRLQLARYCSKTFSLMVVDKIRQNVARMLVIDFEDVLGLLNHLNMILRHDADGTPNTPFPALVDSLDDVTVATPGFLKLVQKLLGFLFIEPKAYIVRAGWITAIRLIVHMIDLAVLSYAGAHIGDFSQYFLQKDLRIIDVLSPVVKQDAVLESVHLQRCQFQCLDNFHDGEPIWIFSSSTWSPQGPLYLSTTMEGFADIWGPLWKAADSQIANKYTTYVVGNGCIFPWQRGDSDALPMNGEIFCHWVADREQEGEDDSGTMQGRISTTFDGSETLLIGAISIGRQTLRANGKCPTVISDTRAYMKDAGRLCMAGAAKSYIYNDSSTYQLQVGYSGTNASASKQYKRNPGQTLKDALIELWAMEPDLRNPQLLIDLHGIEVSICTLNSRRVCLTSLLTSQCMHRFLNAFAWENEKYQHEYFETLLDPSRPLRLEDSKFRSQFDKAIMLCLKMLGKTGVDRSNNLLVFLSCESTARPELAALPAKEHSWIGLLRDTITECSMAAFGDYCLEFEYDFGVMCKVMGRSVLRTALEVNSLGSDLGITLKRRRADDYEDGWRRNWRVSNMKIGSVIWLGGHGRLKLLTHLPDNTLVMEWEASRIMSALKSLSQEKPHREFTELDSKERRRTRPIPIFVIADRISGD